MTTPPAAPRRRNARGEGDLLRTELLEAAANLLAEHGSVDGVSLRAVARRAGVSATAVYRHFDDHHELVRQSVRHCWDNFLSVLETAVEEGSDAFDAFHRCGLGYARFALGHPGQYRVMFSNRIVIEDETSMVANATFQILIDLVEAMLNRLDDNRDPFTVAVQVHTWIHGIVGLSSAHSDVSWPAVENQFVGLGEALGLVRPA